MLVFRGRYDILFLVDFAAWRRFMKVKAKPIIYAVAAVVAVLAAAAILARVCWGYDVFDRSGWHTAEDGSMQYLDYSGEPMIGWQTVEGKTYYFSPEKSGAMATGWLETDGETYYLNVSGQKHIGWAELDDQRYYFNNSGAMHTGWLETGGDSFYFDKSGIMQTGWLDTEKGRCYLSESGAISFGWVETESGKYYINEDGVSHTGWLKLEHETYYLTEDGLMYTGWLEREDGLYYFKNNGVMAKGKVVIDGRAEYFTSSGKHFILVNRWNHVPEEYEADLVWFDGFQIDSSCRDSLEQMISDCRAAGYVCNLTSAYRGYNYQNTIFQRKVQKLIGAGYTRASAELETSRSIAIPGTSEHHLGLAVDLKSAYSTYGWLAENSWKYGFIMRYPDGTTELTGVYYEPWHFRYVGAELAQELYELDLCVEAYMEMLTTEE